MRTRHATLLLALLAAGCGGGGGGTPKTPASGLGRATFRILWPDRDARFVPASANSLVLVVSLNGTTLQTQTIARPPVGQNETQTNLAGLKYGNLDLSIKAYPTTDGGGVAQAVGQGSLAVSEGSNSAVTVSLASTVASLTIGGASVLTTGRTTALVATAKDADGAMVLLKADAGGEERLEWASDNAAATVVGTGSTAVLTGVADGAANVTATFRPDGGPAVVGAKRVTVDASGVEYKPNVVVLPSGDSRRATLAGTTLTVTGNVADIDVGTVVLSGQGTGLTRRVTGVNGGGSFNTAAATLQDAILACDQTLPVAFDAAEATGFSTTKPGVTNESASTGDLKLRFTDFDVTSGFTKGLIMNGTVSIKMDLASRLRMANGLVAEFGCLQTTQAAVDARIAPSAAGGFALYGTASIGTVFVGTFSGRSREIVPGVVLTPAIDVFVTPRYNDRFYNGLELRIQTAYSGRLDLRYAGGAWASDGTLTASSFDADLAPKAFTRGAVAFNPGGGQLSLTLNGANVAYQTINGPSPTFTTSNVASPTGVRLLVDLLHVGFGRGDAGGLAPGGAATSITPTLKPAAPGFLDKTYPYTGGGGVIIR